MSFSPTHPFTPPKLPPKIDLKDSALFQPLVNARAEIATISGFSIHHPNPMLLLSPALLKESIASSNIEDIHTTVVDVLQNELFPETEQRSADKEVLRYRAALLDGEAKLKKLPISTRLILDIQGKLLPEKPTSGKYRGQQNQIEGPGKAIVYTPPRPPDVAALMGDLENFINDKDDGIDPLLKCAIAHYQFEAIHPFDDGNGRTGRILMVLQMVQANLLYRPILYTSSYLNEHRSDYYLALREVSSKGDWMTYLLFMLTAYYKQALKADGEMLDVSLMHKKLKLRIRSEFPRFYSGDLVDQLFLSPVTNPVSFGRALGIHYTTASAYLKQLHGAGILKNVKKGKYQFFINQPLMDVLKK